MLAGSRERLVRSRTQLANAIRGHAAEFGLVAPMGTAQVGPLLARAASDLTLPALVRDELAGLATDYEHVETRIAAADAKLRAWHRAATKRRSASRDHRAASVATLPAGR